MIKIENGRARSERTPEELEQLLKEDLSRLSPEERKVLDIILQELKEKDSLPAGEKMLIDVLGEVEYKTPPVDIRTFVKDPYYLGETCGNIYPKLLNDLEELFSGGYREAIFTGALGVGKTYTASIGICRVLYEISCLKDPYASYGMSKDSGIHVVCLSVNEGLAQKVAFENITNKIRQSPYFQENFPFKLTKKDIEFPNKVWLAPRATTDTSAVGLNVVSFFLDESDFLGTKKTPLGEENMSDVIYAGLQRRMKSRFERQGRIPGIAFLVSSKRTETDFSARRIKEALTDPTVFVTDYAAWMLRPETFLKETFFVLCGNADVGSRLLTKEEGLAIKDFPPEGTVVLEVPKDFERDFQRDLEGSIRDLGGISVTSIRPFIQRREKIREAVDPSLKHPFSTLVYDMSKGGTFLWDKMVAPRRERGAGRIEFDRLRPLINPGAARHCHIDIGLRKDCLGLCMMHVSGWKDVIRRTDDGREFTERAPIYTMDLALRVVPPIGGEIILAEARHLIYDLVQHGYSITSVSLDSYQSADSLQQFAAKGLNAQLVSVDTDPLPYDMLKMALYENRVRMYQYEPLMSELVTLQEDYTGRKRKIDHPTRGCFVGETRIPLLDGSCPPIETLVGKEVWVYSCTPEGRVVPGKARGFCSKVVTELVDVVLDSGAVIRCTPEHPFMLRHGEYKPARDLRPGMDRLMPISRIWPVNGGYERVTDSQGNRTLSHHLVWSSINGMPVPQGHLIHHENHIKTDNRPENLHAVLAVAHAREHTKLRHETDKEWRKRLYAGAKRFNESEEGRRRHSAAMRRTNQSLTPEDRRKRAQARQSFRSDVTQASIEALRNDPAAINANAAARILDCGRNVIVRVLKDCGFESWEEFLAAEPGNNHKVRYIYPVKLENPVSVFDLEVETWSNFALSAGIFVHNSKDVADAMAAVIFTLSQQKLAMPLPIMRGMSYSNEDAWMDEQRQSAFAGNRSAATNSVLPPFFVGSGSDDWNDPWNP